MAQPPLSLGQARQVLTSTPSLIVGHGANTFSLCPPSPGFLLLLISKSPVAQFDFSAFHHLQQTLYIPFPLFHGQWFLSFWLDSDTVLLGE